MASPTAHRAAAGGAVCCMCGDHGLPHELFCCKRCRVRRQHRYCSDLYPRAAAYRRCNWCLKVKEGGGEGRAKAAASPGTSAAATSDEGEDRQWHGAGCSSSSHSRRGSTTAPGRPVKKQKTDDGVAPAPAKGSGGGKKLAQAGKVAPPVRVKVRRYKLLAEVISCDN